MEHTLQMDDLKATPISENLHTAQKSTRNSSNEVQLVISVFFFNIDDIPFPFYPFSSIPNYIEQLDPYG